MAVANGTAAVSVLQPMFLKPTRDELFLHFKTIAGSIPDTPVLLYNNPGRVGYTLTTPAGAARDGFVRTMDRRRTFIKRSLCHEYYPACPS